MGVQKNKRPTQAPSWQLPPSAIQTVTLSGVSTAAVPTAIPARSQVVLITSTGTGAGHEIALAKRRVGSQVVVLANVNSSVPVDLMLESTTQNLFGSTSNGIRFSTNSSGGPVTLMKVSTALYAVTSWASFSTAARPIITPTTGTV
jgi:hypothetical protein